MNLDELREEIDKCVAEPHTEEAQAVIHDGRTHVAELWEDGEITSTKAGDLYRHRSLHQSSLPLSQDQEILWEVPEGKKHERKVIVDDRARDLIEQFREENCRYYEVNLRFGVGSHLSEEGAKEHLRQQYKHYDAERLLNILTKNIQELEE